MIPMAEVTYIDFKFGGMERIGIGSVSVIGSGWIGESVLQTQASDGDAHR